MSSFSKMIEDYKKSLEYYEGIYKELKSQMRNYRNEAKRYDLGKKIHICENAICDLRATIKALKEYDEN